MRTKLHSYEPLKIEQSCRSKQIYELNSFIQERGDRVCRYRSRFIFLYDQYHVQVPKKKQLCYTKVRVFYEKIGQ